MDGLIIVDKPAGLTSHDVVARVRRALRERRVGHTGTLDPFATGVLVVLTGRATRLAQFLSGAEKEYRAVVRLGYATDTGDSTGRRLEEQDAQNARAGDVHSWGAAEVEAALAGLRGEIEQVPPMYSAKKVQGRKLYELARRGIEVERKPVLVRVRELEAEPEGGELLREGSDGTRELTVRAVCSAGTYVRTLAEAIGERLGTRAHLSSLRRTRAGRFRLEEAVSLAELEEKAGRGDGETFLIPPEAALSGMASLHLTASEAARTLNGVAVRLPAGATSPREGEPVSMLDEAGRLVAVGFYDAATHTLRPRVVLPVENKD